MQYQIELFEPLLSRLAYGATFLEISKNKLKTVRPPCPPVKEQQKIASVLSKVDELIQKANLVIEQTQRLQVGLNDKPK